MLPAVNGGRHLWVWSDFEFFVAIVRELFQIPVLRREHVLGVIVRFAAHRHHHFGARLEVPAVGAHTRVVGSFHVETFGLPGVV